MKVYRLEYLTGDGPFFPANSYLEDNEFCIGGVIYSPKRETPHTLRMGWFNLLSHPEPHDIDEKAGKLLEEGYICGCSELKHLRSWFYPELLKILGECGYRVRVFEVPDESVHKVNPTDFGAPQVVFDRSRATLVEDHEISHVL